MLAWSGRPRRRIQNAAARYHHHHHHHYFHYSCQALIFGGAAIQTNERVHVKKIRMPPPPPPPVLRKDSGGGNMFDESLVTLHSFTPWLQLISDDGQALASIHANVTKSARIITKKILPRLWTAMSHLKDDTGGAGGAGIVLTHSHARALGNHAGRELGLRIWNAMAELMWTGENWMEEREEREWEHEEWTEARDADEEEFMRKFWESTGLPDWEKGFETWKAFNITE